MIEVTASMRHAFARDGAIKAERLLASDELADCRRCFDFNLAHPGPTAIDMFDETSDVTYNDLGTSKSLEFYKPVLDKLGFGDFMADLWGSDHVWYFGEEIFRKVGGKVGRSPWHQDTPYFTAIGPHLANIWISFEQLPAHNALEVVRGSHRATEYDGSSFMNADDHTDPLWGTGDYPRLPDIEAERTSDPGAWDVLSWDLDVGDAIVLHSGCLHGGAPVDAACPDRNTLVLRFFGDDVRYRSYPRGAKPNYFLDLTLFDVDELNDGDLFRSPYFHQLR